MAATATPTIIDPKVLRASQYLTTAIVTQYTAPAGEAGAMVRAGRVAYSGQKNFDKVWNYDASVGYGDETTDAASAAVNDVSIFQTDSAGLADRFYVGMTALKFSHIAFALGTIGTGTPAITAAYWNGSAWTDLTLVANNYVDATTALKLSGELSFTPPASWATNAVNGVTAYWIEIRVTANFTIVPLGNTVKMGTAYSPNVTFYKVPSGQSADDSRVICKTLYIPTDGSSVDARLLGLLDAYLDAGDFIAAVCSAENIITFSADGAELKD